MIDNPLISIIIPVYGVEKYIGKCIESIKCQTFTDFEAIIIDDGSEDESINIAKGLVKDDERFKFITQTNKGQGAARNIGLDYATGDYIAFVDSDDYLEFDFLESMYKKIIASQAEICVCDVNYVDTAHKIIGGFKSNVHKFQVEKDVFLAKGYVSNWLCDKMYKKDVFENMRFDENIRTYEDAHFTFRLIYNKSIVSLNKKLYNYLQRPGSTSHDIKPSYISDRVSVKNSQLNFLLTHDEINYDYFIYTYLKTFVFYSSVNLARYSKKYNFDIEILNSAIDPEIFCLKNILNIFKSDKKIFASLVLYKLSPMCFRFFVQHWFKNHSA